MYHIIKTFNRKQHILILFYLTIFVILLPSELWQGSDDTVYQNALQTTGILDWVWWRATTWQPRLVSDFLIAIFDFCLPAWKIATSFVCALIVSLFCSLSSRNENDDRISTLIYSMICCAFLLIYPGTFHLAVSWYTGSFNYVWPALFLVMALIPFYNALTGEPNKSKATCYIGIIGAALTGYQEQCAAIFCCFAILTFAFLVVKREKIGGILVLEAILTGLNVAVFLSLGGVETRQIAEIYWYKDFPMLSTIDKVFQGVNYGNYHLFHGAELLMLLLSAILLLLAWQKYKSTALRCAFVVPVCIFLAGLLPLKEFFSHVADTQVNGAYYIKTGDLLEVLQNPMHVSPKDFLLSFSDLLPSAFCLFTVLLVGFLIFVICKDRRTGLANMVLYWAALASSYVLGLSPTIFASGDRIFFVTDLFLVFVIALLLRELRNYPNAFGKKSFKVLFLFSFMLAICFAMDNFCMNLV